METHTFTYTNTQTPKQTDRQTQTQTPIHTHTYPGTLSFEDLLVLFLEGAADELGR